MYTQSNIPVRYIKTVATLKDIPGPPTVRLPSDGSSCSLNLKWDIVGLNFKFPSRLNFALKKQDATYLIPMSSVFLSVWFIQMQESEQSDRVQIVEAVTSGYREEGFLPSYRKTCIDSAFSGGK